MTQVLEQRYLLLQELGRGAFAVTHLAQDRATGRRCVVKVLSLAQAESPKAHELFEREARVLANLDHPRIPKFLDFFTEETADDVRVVLVQEQLPGSDLARKVGEGWRASEAEAIAIGVGIASILEYLHAFLPAILHRDIKPSNVLLGEDGSACLIDFGAVRDKVLHDPLLVPGGPTVIGTFGYMPPEQFHGEAEPASDVYSLAATLVFVLSGLEPWEIDKEAMRPVLRPRVPASEELVRVLERALEPDRGRRIATATAFREALAGVAQRPRRQPLAVRTAVRGAAVIGIACAGALWMLLDPPGGAGSRAPMAGRRTTVAPRDLPPAAPLALSPSVEWPAHRSEAGEEPLPPGAVRRLGTARLRHGGPVRALAFSSDGRTLFTAGEDRAVAAWDTTDGSLRQRFEVFMPVASLRLSGDGRRLVVGLGDSSARVFELPAGREIARLLVPAEGGHRLPETAFEPGDSSRLATVTDRGVIDLWRVGSGGTDGHEHRIAACAGSPTGLAYARGAGTGSALHLTCGAERVTIDPRGGTIVARQAMEGGGDRFLAGPDGAWWSFSGASVRKTDGTTGARTLELPRMPDAVSSLAVSADGGLGVAGLVNGTTLAFDSGTGARRQVFEGHHGAVVAVAVSPDGRFAATGGADHTVRIVDLETGRSRMSEPAGHRHAVETLAFSNSGGVLHSGGADGSLVEWDSDGRLRSEHALSGAVMWATPLGPARLLVGERGRLGRDEYRSAVRRLRVFEGAHAVRELPVPPHAWGLAVSRTAQRAATGSATSVHSYALGSEHHAAWGTPAREEPVAFSPDGSVIATLRDDGGYTRTLLLRDAGTGRQLSKSTPHSGGPGSAQCRGADGSFLVHAGSLYRVGRAPRPLLDYSGTMGITNACTVAPDARTVAGVTDEGVQIREARSVQYGRGWDLWRLVWLRAHRGPVTALAFSPDARLLATGGADTQILVWDLAAIRRGIAGAPEHLTPSWPPASPVVARAEPVLRLDFDVRPLGVAPFHLVKEARAATLVPGRTGRALDARHPLVLPETAGILLGDTWSFEVTLEIPEAAFPLPHHVTLVRSDPVHLYLQNGRAQLVLGFLNQGGTAAQDLEPWTGPLTPGHAYHVAILFSRATGTARICVDAVCAPGPAILGLADRIGQLELGDRGPRATAAALLDDVRFHTRLLSDAEIARGAGQPAVRARDVEARP